MTTSGTADALLGLGEHHGINIPPGHVGPVLLSATGRTVWWTGRVAIGLRYEPRHGSEPVGTSALRLQDALLRRSARTAHSLHAD